MKRNQLSMFQTCGYERRYFIRSGTSLTGVNIGCKKTWHQENLVKKNLEDIDVEVRDDGGSKSCACIWGRAS